jgi:hypothetical protein
VKNWGRKPLIVARTPVPGFEIVVCYEDTWTGHILGNHPEVEGLEAQVTLVLEEPSFVVEGTPPTRVVFFNETVLNEYKAPLIVAVSKDDAVVCSVYHKDSWEDFHPTMLKPKFIKWRAK